MPSSDTSALSKNIACSSFFFPFSFLLLGFTILLAILNQFEAGVSSRHDWKSVELDVKNQYIRRIQAWNDSRTGMTAVSLIILNMLKGIYLNIY